MKRLSNCYTVIVALFIIGAFVMGGCSNPPLYSHYEVIDGGEWRQSDEAFFSFSINSDTISQYEVTGQIRYQSSYPYKNLPIGVVYETPQRTFTTSTHLCDMLSDHRYIGGQGYNIYETSFVIDTIVFETPGIHTYSFRPLLRDSVLPGIIEVGILIRKL